MSLEVWGDEGNCGPDGYVTEERAEEAFRAGAQAMREILARQWDSSGGEANEETNNAIAEAVRSVWRKSWGEDPGKPEKIATDCWDV